MSPRWLLALGILAGCGRLSFDGLPGDGGTDVGDGPKLIDANGDFDPFLVTWLDMNETDPSAGITDRAQGAVVHCIADQCPTSAPGAFGQGFSFDGTDDALEVFTTLPVNDYTYEVWAISSSVAFMGVLTSRGTSEPVGGFELDFSNSDVEVWANSFKQLAVPGNLPTLHFYAVTRTGGSVTLYVDGVSVGTNVNDTRHDFHNCPLLVGQDTDAGCEDDLNGPFEGVLDEVRIYSRVLTPSELLADMSSATPLPR